MKKTNNILDRAFAFASKAHKGQKYSGHEFIYHPLQVFRIIEQLAPDDTNLQLAALLHDTLEDTKTTREQLEKKFNNDVATLVWEVTKTGSNTFANLKSLRAITLKLADRTANYSNAESRTDKGPEWLEAYLKKVFWKTE